MGSSRINASTFFFFFFFFLLSSLWIGGTLCTNCTCGVASTTTNFGCNQKSEPHGLNQRTHEATLELHQPMPIPDRPLISCWTKFGKANQGLRKDHLLW